MQQENQDYPKIIDELSKKLIVGEVIQGQLVKIIRELKTALKLGIIDRAGRTVGRTDVRRAKKALELYE